ncbi:MAG: glycosyltransferase family 4 protein [Lachnospiraceae bacterium]|nr:glycosyltransferase family 4 protein [Lachnospiraceae bacterium]
MGSVTVLLSAMGLSDISILDKLNISGSSVIINQTDHEERCRPADRDCLMVSTTERGLSKSRNMAMREAAMAGKELCIFCDNDVLYRDDYGEVIRQAFERNPESDILIFFVERPERHEPVFSSERKLDHLHAMKIFSPEIAFRLSRVRAAGLRMDELFGAGAKYGMGEENIFLFDAMRLGLKITYVPIRIASTVENESSWFNGYTEEFFRNRGAGYYRMSPLFHSFLCLQFALRKRGLYRDSMGIGAALKCMGRGKREYHSEMKVFLAGDYYSGNGPANATKGLLRAMPGNTLCLKTRSKLLRAAEIWLKVRRSDFVVFSGHSRQNIFGMKCAARAGVPSVYIMHGAVEYENNINRVPDEGMAADEREMMRLADRILAVSPVFEEWLKEHYPEYADKTGHLTNGVEWSEYYVNLSGPRNVDNDHGGGSSDASSYVNQSLSVFSVGGGMPRKRINKICEAVKLLRDREGMDISLDVAGDRGADTDEIDSCGFVHDHRIIDRDEMKSLYRKSRVFIQNSVFETFGLAPVEALLSGCDIMISGCCGVKEILPGLKPEDIINDPEDPEEIAEKLKAVFENGNNARILSSVDIRGTGWEKRAEELCRLLAEMKK